MNERKKRAPRKREHEDSLCARRAGEICFTRRRGDRWGVSSCQQIGRTGLRVAQRKQRKRGDGGYLLETVGKTRTDALRRRRAKKKKKKRKERKGGEKEEEEEEGRGRKREKKEGRRATGARAHTWVL